MTPVLSVERLSVGYFLAAGTVRAVRDVSFAIEPGQRLGLVGESGSGKTTAALAIMGLLRPPGRVSGGRILLDGQDLASLDPAAHARLRLARVSYVPQGAMNSLNPVLRVRTSIAHALKAHGGSPDEKRIVDLLAQVGLAPEIAGRYPHELSGGMKQRVCIAIAISLGPRLIIADEPTSALDVITQLQVMHTLHAVQDRLGSAMILIGHDMGLMAQSVDALAVMREGELVEIGGVRRIFRHPGHPYTAKLIDSVPVLGGVVHRQQEAPAETQAAPLLELRDVGKRYGKIVALHPLSLTLPQQPARIVSVVGQSGSGKTTLGSLALGFVAPSEGSIRWEGRPVAAFSRRERQGFRRDVQAVFQDPYSTFNPFYRVARSLLQPLRTFRLARDAADARDRAETACRQVGLAPSLLDRFPHQLSGGQRQRMMVARALLLHPRLLVADEPVSMVDASLRAEILDLLVALRDRHGIAILYITHDLATAYRVSDEVLVLREGHVVERGAPETVLGRPAHAYTRLLVDSLPWPDPDRPWGARAQPETETAGQTHEDHEAGAMAGQGDGHILG